MFLIGSQKKNESNFLTKDRSCECKCKFDGRKCNSNQKWNNYKCQRKCQKHHICEKDIWHPATCSCKNGKYLASITDDLVITYFFFYQYIITHTFKQHKNTITRYKYIASNQEKQKKNPN